MREAFAAWIGALILLALPASAGAQPSDHERRARAHFTSATTYFETGDYESAVREFRAAYAEDPRTELLYNIYLCEERLGHPAEAAAALEQFLAGIAPGDERRETLTLRLANLRRRAEGTAETTTETTTEATTTETTTDGQPPPETIETTEATAGTTVDPTPDPAPTQPPSSDPPYLAIIGFAVAGAGLAAFAIAGGLALAEDSRLAGACGNDCTSDEVSGLRSLTIAADVGLGVAAAGAIVGVIGIVVAATSSSPAPAETALVLPWLTPEGAGIVIGGRL